MMTATQSAHKERNPVPRLGKKRRSPDLGEFWTLTNEVLRLASFERCRCGRKSSGRRGPWQALVDLYQMFCAGSCIVPGAQSETCCSWGRQALAKTRTVEAAAEILFGRQSRSYPRWELCGVPALPRNREN